MDKIECPQCHHKTASHLSCCNECGALLKEEPWLEKWLTLASDRPNFMSFILALVALFLPLRYLDVIVGLVALSLSFQGIKKKEEQGFAFAAMVIVGLSLLVKLLAFYFAIPIYLF